MTKWKGIDTAPTDGTVVNVKRVYDGRIVYEGPAVWRSVRFSALDDPLKGKEYAEAYTGTGWMYPDKDYRVPEPTHWRPTQ